MSDTSDAKRQPGTQGLPVLCTWVCTGLGLGAWGLYVRRTWAWRWMVLGFRVYDVEGLGRACAQDVGAAVEGSRGAPGKDNDPFSRRQTQSQNYWTTRREGASSSMQFRAQFMSYRT